MGWSLDKGRGVWAASKFSDLDPGSMNNLFEYGEPFTPYEKGFVPETDYNLDFANIIVEVSQQEVMIHGYGKGITADDFPIVKRFLTEPTLPFPSGTYTFNDLVKLKYAIIDKKKKRNDRFYKAKTYIPWGPYSIDVGDISRADAAYVHGTVCFALMDQTKFIATASDRTVKAEIGAGDDNFDFDSSTVPFPIEVAVAMLVGPDNFNAEKPIIIRFVGPGKLSVVQLRAPRVIIPYFPPL